MQGLEGAERLRRLGVRVAVVAAVVLALAAAALVLNSGCFADTKTNLCEASGRRCAPGQVCAFDQDVCIPIGGCGDGIVDTTRGEICDDGNIMNGDGCNRYCDGIERCGDGTVDVDVNEDCDSMKMDTPRCDKDCSFARCGDNYINTAAGEECDTPSPNLNTPDCIAATCMKSICGDHYQNALAGESCDTGIDSQGCNGPNAGTVSCKLPRCGDGYLNEAYKIPGKGNWEKCDRAGDHPDCNGYTNDDGLGNCQRPSCGDGYRNPTFITPDGKLEVCDDGKDTKECNGSDDDGNIFTNAGVCQIPKCGDGYINKAAGENCDTGLTSDPLDDLGCTGKTCKADCKACNP